MLAKYETPTGQQKGKKDSSVLQEMVSNYILLLEEKKKNVELNKPISMHQQHNIIMRTKYKIARNLIACFSLKV